MRYFLIGIKGAGMAALGKILIAAGHQVRGVDHDRYVFTEDGVRDAGILIQTFADPFELNPDEIVIYSTAFSKHDWVKTLEAATIKYEYHQFLADFIKDYYAIAIAGTHGKTTTTAIIYAMLKQFGPVSALIGDGSGYYEPGSRFFVFEACEFERHFLAYHPQLLIINNIDYDHPDTFPDLASYYEAFAAFSKQAENVIINADENPERLAGLTFGLSEGCQIRANNLSLTSDGIGYQLSAPNRPVRQVHLPFYGVHMIYNTLAALATCYVLGLNEQMAISGIKQFKGVARRFRETITAGNIFIDDYAHHPRAIMLTLRAVRDKYPGRKVIVIFQPDRYSRVYTFVDAFAASLDCADEAYVLPFAPNTDQEGYNFNAGIIASAGKNISYLANPESAFERFRGTRGKVFLLLSSKDQRKHLNALINLTKNP